MCLQGLDKDGWNAVYVALFGTMIGSTDAASCIAILKAGSGRESREGTVLTLIPDMHNEGAEASCFVTLAVQA